MDIYKGGLKLKNHLLTYWPFGLETKGFKNMCRELAFERCTYIYEDEKEKIAKDGYFGIYLYNGISFYSNDNMLKQNGKVIPLDKNIIESLRPYEMTAMSIINRWRRSVSAEEGYAEIKRLYYIYVSYWWNYINTNKITHLFLGAVPHIPLTYIPYAICKTLQIPVLFLEPMAAFYGERQNHLLKESIETIHNNFDELYEMNRSRYIGNDIVIPLKKEMEQYFIQYSQDNMSIKRIIIDNGDDGMRQKIQLYLDRIQLYLERKDLGILTNKIIYAQRAKRKSKYILRYEEKMSCQPDFSERYIFFPLHYQPEATTLPGAGIYENQLLVIKMLSYCLPDGVYLYVKEHPAFWNIKSRREGVHEARSEKYYDEIIKLENVKLIAHEYNSLELMDHCEALVTENGTAGLECLFKNRPVIVFGNARYKKYKYTYAVDTIEDCQKALKKILLKKKACISKMENIRELRVYAKTLEPLVCSFDWGYINYVKTGVSDTIERDVLELANMVVKRFSELYESECGINE